jgi:hypothetical protein
MNNYQTSDVFETSGVFFAGTYNPLILLVSISFVARAYTPCSHLTALYEFT